MNEMKKNRSLLLSSLLLLMLLTATAAVADNNAKTIFYNVTTDEAWAAGMAIGQATKALESGYNVKVFLNVRGVFLASKSFTTDTSGSTGKSLQEMLEVPVVTSDRRGHENHRQVGCRPVTSKRVGFGLL